MSINWKNVRDYAVIGVIGFGMILALYVSIPDFPYKANAWELFLWGEESQWWSEITWICGFVVLSVLALLITSWNLEVKSTKKEEFYLETFRYVWAISVVSILFHYSTYYFNWTNTTDFFLNDSGGYLHGLFYLLTFFIFILVFVESLAYMSKVHGYVLKLSELKGLE